MKKSCGITRWLCLGMLLMVFSGCGEDQVVKGFKNVNDNNIKKVANSYRMFASVNNYTGPKDEQELKNFILTDERVPPRLGLTSIDAETVDAFFTSEVDGEPFTIRYGLQLNPDVDLSPVVFEKTGENGMRRVGLASSDIVKVDNDKRYENMLKGKTNDAAVAKELFDESMSDLEAE